LQAPIQSRAKQSVDHKLGAIDHRWRKRFYGPMPQPRVMECVAAKRCNVAGESNANRPTRPRQRCGYDKSVADPSPPLLPGPHNTRTGRGLNRRSISLATASPARCMSSTPGVPAATASRSASFICSAVKRAEIKAGPPPRQPRSSQPWPMRSKMPLAMRRRVCPRRLPSPTSRREITDIQDRRRRPQR